MVMYFTLGNLRVFLITGIPNAKKLSAEL